MRTTWRILRYELRDLARGKWLFAYALFVLAFAEALFRMEGSGARVLLSLVDVVLLLLPLVSVVFGTVYLYGSREFVELLLAQPITRRQLFGGLYLGLALALSGAFLAGVLLPFAAHGLDDPAQLGVLLTLAATGVLLTFVFVALAFLVALRFEDRLKGLGTAMVVWFAFGLVYDGLVLLFVSAFGDHPLETPLVALVLANPVDLARVLLLLRLDVAALMGYTGAIFDRLLGGAAGGMLALAALAGWVAVPVLLGMRAFGRKDF